MLQYTMKSFCRFFVAALCFGAAFTFLSPVRAQNAVKPESLKTATTQVDGITSRIVDNLWEESDHYWHEGDYNRIIALVRVCVEVDPSFVEAYSSGAWLMWSQGDTRAADTFLQYGLSRAPQAEKGDMAYEFGWHLYNTKRFAEALPYLKRATDNNVQTVTAYTTLGHCYRQLKRYDDSVKAWETVIKKFPKFASGPSNLARVKALQAQNR